jgi:hypothetical protein
VEVHQGCSVQIIRVTANGSNYINELKEETMFTWLIGCFELRRCLLFVGKLDLLANT